MRNWLGLAEIAFVTALAAIIFISWREDRRDRSQLVAQLAAAQQSLNEASSRQHDRDAQLDKSLADLAAQKRSVVTPTEILAALPKQIPLPAPITLQPDGTSSQDDAAATPRPSRAASISNPQPKSDSAATAAQSDSSATLASAANGGAVIPREDLKPLYDFALDCKACQAKLAAAQSDLQDERVKTATLAKERDEAVRAAKGGSAWRRATRAAKWFFIGAAAGIIAAKAHH